MAGGTTVTITGMNFTGATAVLFGGTAATSFSVSSDTQITATAPAGASGPVDITVTTPSGTSATGLTDQYTYAAAAPTVTALSTTSGPTGGGTLVTITGSNLTGALGIAFGGTAASVFRVNSDSSVTAVSPIAVAGVVDITVTTANGTSATSAADQFTYVAGSATPAVTALTPPSGSTSGGNVVTITGTNLSGATQVFFGAARASAFTVVSATAITATAPAGVAGVVDVTVSTVGGVSSATAADHYTYVGAAPTVTGVSPASDTTAGGSAITLTGTGFIGATSVAFGTTVLYSFTVNSDTSLTAIDPVHAPGTVDVTVTTPNGTSTTSAADRFSFTASSTTPTVTGISPSTGPTGGGTSVAISGTNFAGAMQVSFGSTSASSFVINSATSITATAPAQVAGTVDVTVTTALGISAATAADLYTAAAAAPTVSAVTPNSGPLNGGAAVTITGTNLNGATAVLFGTTAATAFTVVSATQITATAPAGTAGTVDLTVTTPYGTSATSAADHYSYVAAPTVSGISPTSGPTLGGTVVTIAGTNFTSLVSVSFGGTPATALTVNSATQLTATAPAHAAGTVDIVVTSPNGSSAVSAADQFSFLRVASTATVTSSVNPSTYGQAVTFTATVSATGPTPTGTVTFLDGTTALGSASLNASGQATFATSALLAGSHSITVIYGGDGNFSSSTSAAVAQTVNKTATTTTLSSSASPSVYGQAVTLTATVSPVAPGGGTATGIVTFYDGSTNIGTGVLNASGQATLTISTLSVASHNLTATYAGDANCTSSSSGTLSQTVNRASSSVAVVSSANPAVVGQTVTFTATVSPVAPSTGTPTGSVIFKDGSTTLATVNLTGGSASYSTAALAKGSHSITVVYSGDSNFITSTSSALSQTVNQAATTTTVTSSHNPSTYGQSVTFTATVAIVAPGAGTPSGTVTFKDGSTTLGTVSFSSQGQATFTTSALAAGSHSITAVYNSDSNFTGSTSSALTQSVLLDTTVTVTSSNNNPSTYGQSVTFTATVTATPPAGGVPTGTVTFMDGNTVLGTGTLNSAAQATFTTSLLTAGSHSITAVYGGDVDYAGSTSAVLTETVNLADTSTTLSSSANSVPYGQPVTFTVAVTSFAGARPSGTVQFWDGSTLLGTGTLVWDATTGQMEATFTTSSLSRGSHSIHATYLGDSNLNGSTSSNLSEMIV
jgi:hypothetical protein